MSKKTAFRAVDFLAEQSRDSEWIELTFIGGEPLLEFDLIQSVIAYTQNHPIIKEKNKRVSFTITTNGTLLEEKYLCFFHDSCCRFLLSIDGVGKDNDGFRKMHNGQSQYDIFKHKMPLFKVYQPWQGVRMTVVPQIARHLAKYIEALHRELKINQFVIGFATGVFWKDEQITDYCLALKETFEFLLRERVNNKTPRLRISLLEVGVIEDLYAEHISMGWGCGAGSGRIAVAPDGTIYGCTKLAFASNSSGKPLSLGNVFDGFIQVKNRLALLDHSVGVHPKCKLCSLANRCNGGCYAVNFVETGNIYVPSDSYCKLLFAQMEAMGYARNRLRELGYNRVNWGNGDENADIKNFS